MDRNQLVINLIVGAISFASGLLIAFFKGLFDETFKKREEKRKDIKDFMGKMIDVVAIATSSRYKLRLNEVDKRKLLRCAFHLEKLVEVNTAVCIRSYINKWLEVYGIDNGLFKTFPSERNRKISLIKDLDSLTDSILKG